MLQPKELAYSTALTEYGVLPLAANPIKKSFFVKLKVFKSLITTSLESSVLSLDILKALSPPAIIPTNTLLETPKVGGHSEASKTPSLPLVPAPI